MEDRVWGLYKNKKINMTTVCIASTGFELNCDIYVWVLNCKGTTL